MPSLPERRWAIGINPAHSAACPAYLQRRLKRGRRFNLATKPRRHGSRRNKQQSHSRGAANASHQADRALPGWNPVNSLSTDYVHTAEYRGVKAFKVGTIFGKLRSVQHILRMW
jgi:hypothetical protein